MLSIFNGDDYHVYVNYEVMILTPNNINARVLMLTPPGVKPQFYSLLAILLVKSGIEVIMPRLPLPCNQTRLKEVIHSFSKKYYHDLILMLGFDTDNIDKPKLVIEFSNDHVIRQLIRSDVPGSVHSLLINECMWVKNSIRNSDLSVNEEVPSLNTIINIRDFTIKRVLHLKGASKNK